MAENGIGAPNKLDDERQKLLLNAVRLGTPLKTAALYADVDDETIRQWRRKGEEARNLAPSLRTDNQEQYVTFMVRLNQALSEAALLAQRNVHTLMNLDLQNGTVEERRIALDASKFYLTHRDAKNYSARTELTGPEGGPVEVVTSGYDVWKKMQAIVEEDASHSGP